MSPLAPLPRPWNRAGTDQLTQDEDVLDTWFSSALWPFATLGWPQETPDFDYFYPTDFLTTAGEILRLWVARMVMMGLEFTAEKPFSRCLHSRDCLRQKKAAGCLKV